MVPSSVLTYIGLVICHLLIHFGSKQYTLTLELHTALHNRIKCCATMNDRIDRWIQWY